MAFEISNYYEKAVIEKVLEHYGSEEGLGQDALEDIVCVALNQLPAKYVRHAVDLAFYMDAGERAEMERKIEAAIAEARDFVQSHRR